MQTLRAVKKTGLVLVKYLIPVGAYRADDVGGLRPDDALMAVNLKAVEPAPVPADVETVDTGLRPSPGETPNVVAADADVARRAGIEIPADWRDQHQLKRRKLAEEIARAIAETAAEADAVIEAELSRRAG